MTISRLESSGSADCGYIRSSEVSSEARSTIEVSWSWTSGKVEIGRLFFALSLDVC
jgi:hypothetical protein